MDKVNSVQLNAIITENGRARKSTVYINLRNLQVLNEKSNLEKTFIEYPNLVQTERVVLYPDQQN